MNEILITVVGLESHGSNETYVTTRVVRMEFDTKDGLQAWLEQATTVDEQNDFGIANVENLRAS